MSADKRSVHTDALATLGLPEIDVDGVPAARDAIHLAVEPVIAGALLKPGERVVLRKTEEGLRAFRGDVSNGVGIVDPFLVKAVKKGQKFWLVLNPRTITSLRHVWAHPAFDSEVESTKGTELLTKISDPKETSKAYLESVAETLDVTLSALIRHAEEFEANGTWWVSGGDFEGIGVGNDFWKHLSVYTGKEYKSEGNFLSCSC